MKQGALHFLVQKLTARRRGIGGVNDTLEIILADEEELQMSLVYVVGLREPRGLIR